MSQVFPNGLVIMIINANHKQEVIDFIKSNYTKIRIPELNSALEWIKINYKEYKTKDEKCTALIKFLNEEN